MLKQFTVLLALLTSAQESEAHSVPATISLFGPLSSNGTAYDQTASSFCIGLINCAHLEIHGISAAYGYNQTKTDLTGVGIGGVGNFVGGNSYGVEFGFVTNINGGHMYGLQLSLINVVQDHVYGAQMGFLNFSGENVGGLQFGAANIILAQDEGGEFAVQFGLLNVSNQERVIPIGFLSLARGGRLSMEFSWDSVGYGRVTLLSGSRYFYTILDCDSRELNPGKLESYHRERPFIRSATFGAAFPIGPHTNVRLEDVAYSPTWYARDALRGYRVVGEFAPSPYFSYHAGLERLAFREPSRRRSDSLASKPDRFFSLTAGVSVNALGWWK